MKCPVCENKLEVTHRGRYQDTTEHVSSPNAEPSLKDGYQCQNEYCVSNNLGAVWIYDGSIFISNPPSDIKWTVAHKIIETASKSGMYWALESWNHNYHLGKRKVKKASFSIKIWEIKLEFIPKEKGYRCKDENKQYFPNYFKWKMEIWRGTDKDGYTSITPLTSMVPYMLKKFKRSYRDWETRGDEREYKECKRIILCVSPWGKPDDRRYAKISSFLVKFIYPFKYQRILKSPQWKTVNL